MNKKLNCILLIDDEPITNFLHKKILSIADVAENIIVALNGEEALKIILNSENNYPQPELIFLDINMPIMNGWEFMEEYQKLEKNLKIGKVIIMLTTSLNPTDVKKASSIPEISDYRNKPLEIEMVKKLVEEYFNQKNTEEKEKP